MYGTVVWGVEGVEEGVEEGAVTVAGEVGAGASLEKG